MSRLRLDRIHIQAFGKFFDKNIGPFSPGLNVVYGENEAERARACLSRGGTVAHNSASQ